MDRLSSLSIDLYELTMFQTYMEYGMTDEAIFEFFVRDVGEKRSFLVAAGLEAAADFLEQFSYTDDELTRLKDMGMSSHLLTELKRLKFTGDVLAVPEGTLVFAGEPFLQVKAPLPEAQIVETALINLLQFPTLIASKAARCYLAAGDKAKLVDFGLRRAHGFEAGWRAARASYIAGFQATSNVFAGAHFGIPTTGTMAHSFIQAHNSEQEAFERFGRSHPDNVVLLIDTYHTLEGARNAIAAADTLARENIHVKAVRIDSGNLLQDTTKVRSLLDSAGLEHVQIFVSGSIDEWKIKHLMQQDAPIDGFGVGTKLDTSADLPYLECAYKLVEYKNQPRVKLSTDKDFYPGPKQIYRTYNKNGRIERDMLAMADEPCDGEALLKPLIQNGKRAKQSQNLQTIRNSTLKELKKLPLEYEDPQTTAETPVQISNHLQELKKQLTQAKT